MSLTRVYPAIAIASVLLSLPIAGILLSASSAELYLKQTVVVSFLILLLFFNLSLLRMLSGREKRHWWDLLGLNSEPALSEPIPLSDLFLPSIVEGSVSSHKQLGIALSDLLERAKKHLNLRGIEVSLFDHSTNLFYFAYTTGIVPVNGDSQHYIQPLTFSGKVLGSVRFVSYLGSTMDAVAQENAKLFALQVGVLFVNAEYSSELKRMQRSADETQKARTGFLANLSHEIRSPLGVIVNATELVLDELCGSLTPDQKHMLSLAKKGSDHLLELLNDVLDYAKIEAGKLSPQKKDILLADLLKDVTSLIRMQAEQKKISVDLRDATEALAVHCDRKHLRQMMINLLTNAVKYTTSGGSVEVWAERAPHQTIKIYVKDSGVGIDPSDRDKVFAPFERLNNQYSRQQVGVGLGLSLSRRLAELNGGMLDYTSISGEGSTFWLQIRSSEPAALDLIGKEAPLPIVKGKGEPVVIVDSDPDHLNILQRYLSDMGYSISAFAKFSEAAPSLERKETELLVMDNAEFDDTQGLAQKELAALVQRTQLSVLLLSSKAFLFDIEKYLRLGVERCLPKPVPLKELATLCREILDARHSGQAIKTMAGITADTPSTDGKEGVPDSPDGIIVH